MWILALWRWCCGTVTFCAQGGLCERFLNLLKQQTPPVELWGVTRRPGEIVATCRADDYHRLRHAAHRTGTRVHAVKKHGWRFVSRPVRRRPGLLVGMAAALAIYFVLASRIWVIDIRVSDPTLHARVAEHLEQHGVVRGADANAVDVPAIRMSAIGALKEINHLSLYFDGSIAHVGVQLQETILSAPDISPANIIASDDGRILSMEVTAGQAIAKVGEGVVKGDLLVCGAIETDNGILYRHSAAIVMAETNYTFEQCVSLNEPLPYIDRTIIQPTAHLFSLALPLYSSTTVDDDYTVSESEHFFELFDVTLPVGITTKQYTHRTLRNTVHTPTTAEQLAYLRLHKQAAAVIGENEVITAEFHGKWEGDTYRLTGDYICHENIAVAVPMLIDNAP